MAQSTTFINGTAMKIFVDDVLLGFVKDTSADVSSNMIDTSNKDAGDWAAFMPGRKTGTISGSALLRFDATEGFNTLFDDIDAGTEIAVRISNEIVGDNELFAAKCLVSSLSLSFPDDDVVSYDFEFQVTGEITYPVIT